MSEQIKVCKDQRNEQKATVNWCFSSTDARVKQIEVLVYYTFDYLGKLIRKEDLGAKLAQWGKTIFEQYDTFAESSIHPLLHLCTLCLQMSHMLRLG